MKGPIARTILSKRILRPGETAYNMVERVAGATFPTVGDVLKRTRLVDMMGAGGETTVRFLFNSPALAHLGSNAHLNPFACFVINPEDSIESIFATMKDAATIHQAGGGTGFNFDALRPEGWTVSSSQGEASGPVSFMEFYNAGTEVIKQGGIRRGANMGTLSISHPDINQFIHLKRDLGRLNNFNISVLVDDWFFVGLKKGLNVCQQFPVSDFTCLTDKPAETICPHPNCTGKHVPAQELWDDICLSAWTSGDPGLLFIDRANATNPNPHLYTLRASNPCGEQWLAHGESCVLGSLNLAAFVLPDTGQADWADRIDWDLLADDTELAVEALDNLINVAHYPLPFVEAATKRARRIGLGVMGWADLLIVLKVPYDSPEALLIARKLGSFIRDSAHNTSTDLAYDRGSYPGWEGSVWHQQDIPVRNSAVTTIAPTGTISLLAECSSGIEPIFSFVVTREQADTTMLDTHPAYQEWLEQGMPAQDYLVDASQVSLEWHIAHQAVWQEVFSDNAVSKTVNMPNTATVMDVESAYLLAHESGCKGITIYRDQSRDEQVLSAATTGSTSAPIQAERCGDEGCDLPTLISQTF